MFSIFSSMRDGIYNLSYNNKCAELADDAGARQVCLMVFLICDDCWILS